MNRHKPHTDRTRAGLQSQTVAASALAGSCLAVVVLWRATAGGATGSAAQ